MPAPALPHLLAVLAACAIACGDPSLDADLGADIEGDDPAADLADDKGDGTAHLPLRFLPGELFVPSSLIRHEVRRVFRSEAALEAELGIDNPGIDFSREWGVFYTPGTSRPDLRPGFRARIDHVSLSSTGLTLKVTTALEQNGNCPPRSSRPFLLVAIPIPDEPPPYTRLYRADRTRACDPDITWLDDVPFTAAQVAGALRAANLATAAQLGAAGITGTQRSIVIAGRAWSSLALLASRPNIGPSTMEKLRTLGAQF